MNTRTPDPTEVIRMGISKQVMAARFDHNLEGEKNELATAISEGVVPWPISDPLFDALLKKGNYDGVRTWKSFNASNSIIGKGSDCGKSAENILAADASLIHLLIQYRLIDASASQNQRFVDSFLSFKSRIQAIRKTYGGLDLACSGPGNQKFSDVTAIYMADGLYRMSLPEIVPYLDLGQIKSVYSCLRAGLDRHEFISKWIDHAAFQRDIAAFFSDELHQTLQDITRIDRGTRVKNLELARRIDEGLGLIRQKPPPPEMKRPLKPPKKAAT